MSDAKRKAEVLAEIQDSLNQLSDEEDIHSILDQLIKEYNTKSQKHSILIQSLKAALHKIKQKEHQSGVFRTLVASVCGSTLTNVEVAVLLDIDQRSVAAAKKRRTDWNNSVEYSSLHVKPVIHRCRMDEGITNSIKKWMEQVFTPSSNTDNVIHKKMPDGSTEYVVKHWRTDTFDNMYAQYLNSHPEHAGYFGRNYFISMVPWYVKKKPYYSGLCHHHELGKYYSDLLTKARKIWHKNCTCECKFCKQCKHGTLSTGPRLKPSCHNGSCTNCVADECPMEWKDDVQLEWKEHYYERNEKGKQVLKEEVVVTSRQHFSSRVAFELARFEAHEAHCQHFAYQYQLLVNNLKEGEVVTRWDFIGK
jgi:hypothetical protein